MSFNLIVVREMPYQGRRSQEILEAIMSLALFDIEHRVVFVGDGVHWLHQEQQPVAQKSLEKQLRALPMYGCEDIYYCAEHCSILCPESAFGDLVEPVSAAEIAQWLRDAQHVEVF